MPGYVLGGSEANEKPTRSASTAQPAPYLAVDKHSKGF
jgi:hypothetical protein